MPKYDYACIQCDKTTEVTRGFNDAELLPKCPECGYNMSRVYNPVGIQFKGSGFYKTDNG